MLTTIQSSDVYITQEIMQHIGISAIQQHIDVEEGRVIYREAEKYDGEYEVTPKAHEQTVLQTRDKLMEDNVTVLQIPYYETSNMEGTTVYIADEVN